jgi:transposase
MHIERVDELPIILHWLIKMRVQAIIDTIWHPHRNWTGLSYGQLAVLFVTYVLHQRNHRLSCMEKWLVEHHTVLEQATGWSIGSKEATDDRLGILLSAMGEDEEESIQFQRQMGSHLIQAFELPTRVGRYDTSTFSVHHAPPRTGESKHEVLRFGHSKDRRPDLVQFKQGLGTLDPAGVPIFTDTISGERADDGLYVPAWRNMAATIGHTDFLYVADCKGAAGQTRATIDDEGGWSLFPMPMTGDVPDWLHKQVLDSPLKPQKIYLPGVVDENDQPKAVGQGFVVQRMITAELQDGTPHTWREQWFVTQSFAHAERQRAGLQNRVAKTTRELTRMRPKAEETVVDLQLRAEHIIQKRRVSDYISVTVQQKITTRKRYLKPGRPRPDSPFRLVEERRLQLKVQVDEAAVAQARLLAGWRVYVSNISPEQMTLCEAVAYYRDEWLVERGFHRFKRGSLPVLPLWIRLPERIRGLMLLLFVALQALTLIEFVARRTLADQQETLAGLTPGNPKRKTSCPTAERLLSVFDNLHLIIEKTETCFKGYLNETLTPLQRRILALLNLPEGIYDLCFTSQLPIFINST